MLPEDHQYLINKCCFSFWCVFLWPIARILKQISVTTWLTYKFAFCRDNFLTSLFLRNWKFSLIFLVKKQTQIKLFLVPNFCKFSGISYFLKKVIPFSFCPLLPLCSFYDLLAKDTLSCPHCPHQIPFGMVSFISSTVMSPLSDSEIPYEASCLCSLNPWLISVVHLGVGKWVINVHSYPTLLMRNCRNFRNYIYARSYLTYSAPMMTQEKL